MSLSKPAKILNTLLNPVTTETWTPEWFTPLGKDMHKGNAALFHAAAMLATYGTLGYGTRVAQEMMGDRRAKEKVQRAIKSHTQAGTSLMNPDPDITDKEGLDLTQNPYLQKKANGFNPTKIAINASGLFLPALAAYTAFLYGNKKADQKFDEDQRLRTEGTINKLENVYQKANFERMLESKGLSPEEVQAKAAELMKAGEQQPAAEAAKKPEAGSLSDVMDKTAGISDYIREQLNINTPKSEGVFDPIWALAVLGLGGVGYGSYKIAKNYLEDQDPEMRRAKMIKKELERHFSSKKPTEIIPDFDPRISDILNRAAPAKEEKPAGPVIDSVPESDSLVNTLNT